MFVPRIGVAYRWNEKTVLRMGFGMFRSFWWQVSSTTEGTGAETTTTMVNSRDGVTPADLLSNPFPQGLVQPTTNSGRATLVAPTRVAWTSGGATSQVRVRGERLGDDGQASLVLRDHGVDVMERGPRIVAERDDVAPGGRGASGPLREEVADDTDEKTRLSYLLGCGRPAPRPEPIARSHMSLRHAGMRGS